MPRFVREVYMMPKIGITSFESGAEQTESLVEQLRNEANESDNLIPVAPHRPSRTRKVRLIKRGKDRPLPAEDP